MESSEGEGAQVVGGELSRLAHRPTRPLGPLSTFYVEVGTWDEADEFARNLRSIVSVGVRASVEQDFSSDELSESDIPRWAIDRWSDAAARFSLHRGDEEWSVQDILYSFDPGQRCPQRNFCGRRLRQKPPGQRPPLAQTKDREWTRIGPSLDAGAEMRYGMFEQDPLTVDDYRTLEALDLASFPSAANFEIELFEVPSEEGRCLRFVDHQLCATVEFPWWDDVDSDLRRWTLSDVPLEVSTDLSLI